MTKIVKDRVAELTTVTGTGNVTLLGPIAGCIAFSSAVAVGDTFDYCIESIGANGLPLGEWEIGVGTYSAPNTIQRTTFVSSNTGSPVAFAAGTKIVSLTVSGQTIGAMVDEVAQTRADYAAQFVNMSALLVAIQATVVEANKL